VLKLTEYYTIDDCPVLKKYLVSSNYHVQEVHAFLSKAYGSKNYINVYGKFYRLSIWGGTESEN
jgi:hypothetical protein